MAIIESIPNVSEGRRADVIERLVSAVRAIPGVRLLDHSSDASHNRSVLTLVGDAVALKAATMARRRRSTSGNIPANIHASAPSTSSPSSRSKGRQWRIA
jgi:glutamate formiminotransferase